MSASPVARHLTIAGLTAAAAVVIAGCGSSSSGPTAGGTNTPAAPPTSSQPTSQSTSTTGGSSNTVTATESEFKIQLSTTSFTAGTYTFIAKNVGDDTHALTIDGPGLEDKSTGDVSPGTSKSMTVTLKAGKYEIYCPVGDHKAEGMDDHITVT